MKIARLVIKDWLGISLLSIEPGKINFLSGATGSGKTSIVEAMEKALTNKNRRTEVIRHGADEATIYIQTDTGMEIDRKIRNAKADYLKVKNPGQPAHSNETFLKKLFNGEIFRPLEFVGKDTTVQAKIILNMLEIPWTMENIANWFGEIPEVNYEDHILKVLKVIEDHYFKLRTVVNGEVDALKMQIKGHRDGLPPKYDGKYWREQDVAGLYDKVSKAEEVNRNIEAAKSIIEGSDGRIAVIRAEAETEKQTKKNELDKKRNEIREFKAFLGQKIEKANSDIAQVDTEMDRDMNSLDSELERKLFELRGEYLDKQEKVKRDSIARINTLLQQIADHKASITNKDFELSGMETVEKNSLTAISEKAGERIKAEVARVETVKVDATREPIPIEPLKEKADEVVKMQGYLRSFDLIESLTTEKLIPKEELAKTLTTRIEKGREMPKELLKTAAVPIPGIEIDSEGRIRINGTLIDGLSEGEQLKLAWSVAKQQARDGDLNFICLDGFNKINGAEREFLVNEINNDDFQYFLLETTDFDLKIDVMEEIK